MSGFFPIASGGKLIYRTYNGITSVYLKEVRDGNDVSKPGDIDWRSTPFDGALGNILDPQIGKDVRPNIDDWLKNTYRASGFINLVYENSMVGTLSTDHRYVFAVDDLAVPIPPGFLANQIWNTQAGATLEKVKPLVLQNRLQAFELETGKFKWVLPVDPKNKEQMQNDPDVNKEFLKSHFLGAPLPLGGKLYALNEKDDGTLRLVCIDAATGKVILPIQSLGSVSKEHRIIADISRRSTAVHLAAGDGVLVCPTNAGTVFGIDLLTRGLAWAYPYRQTTPDPRSLSGPNTGVGNRSMALSYENWKVSPPMIADGKVVFTAPDAVSVHCLNLRDGLPVWTHRRHDNDLFLAAIIQDQVLIVGKNSVRFLRLSDGITLGSLPTGGLPSGQGVASNNVYYLPVQKRENDGTLFGEILAIDVPRRIIKAHNVSVLPVGPDNPAPGNLVFYEGAVLSQTPTHIVAYPQLTAKVELANAALAKDPNSLERRFERGALLLADGQVQAAVDDLRIVRQKQPPQPLADKVNQKLYEALTTLLQSDFGNASVKYLDEYAALCKLAPTPEEQQRRTGRMYRIIGQGREAQGDLVAAFKAYRQFGALPLSKSEGVASLEDPGYKIPTTVWLRGRIGAMIADPNIKKEQRAALEQEIDKEWQLVSTKGTIDELRGFAAMFDVPVKVGREARLRLAGDLIERKDPGTFLEAELALQQLRVGEFRADPSVGGMALEMLARLEKRKAAINPKQGDDALKQAAAYYRQLSEEFGNVPVRDGKTGQDLLNELTNDKRVLAHLEEEAVLWGKADMKHRTIASAGIVTPPGFTFYPTGDVSPYLRQHRLVLGTNFNAPVLMLINSTTGKEAWRISLENEPRNVHFFNYLQYQADRNAGTFPNARFRYYHARGHLAVVQAGIMVYGVDTGAGKLLWSYCVLDALPQGVMPGNAQIMTDNPNPQPNSPPNDGTLWYITNTPGQSPLKSRIGHVGAVEASYVALTTQRGLVVLDPLRGNVLWSKLSVPPQTEVFGDEQNIYLVEMSPLGAVAGAGRALRAVDGAPVEVQDFSGAFRHRVRILGRNILVSDTTAGLTIRLYDVLTGKDLYRKEFAAGAVMFQTEDPYLAGVVDGKGVLTVIDLRLRKELFACDLLHAKDDDGKEFPTRVTQDDIKKLVKPVLLRDSEYFYVALNQPIDATKIAGGVVSSNFNNGLRCQPVNGWFCCIDAKGTFVYHLSEEIKNHMIVVEHFRHLPVLIFSSRHTRTQFQPGVGQQQTVWRTLVFSKNEEGRAIYWGPNSKGVKKEDDEEEKAPSATAKFSGFAVDVKNGTINLIGNQAAGTGNVIEQLYIDDGRKRADNPPVGGGGVGVAPPVIGVQPPVAQPPLPPVIVNPKIKRGGR
jgi:outer membrane protein assembly factor BamB